VKGPPGHAAAIGQLQSVCRFSYVNRAVVKKQDATSRAGRAIWTNP
jgi:hypothetical protein